MHTSGHEKQSWLGSIFVRNMRAMDQLEAFLVASVTIILLIRIFLKLSGYPQLGGGGLHIAHMLWGGLGMLVAALLRLMLLGKWVEYASAFIGGIGFGTFIDEIGKFVTQDNDYFFAPSFSLMYVTFVAVYLVAHWALTSRGYSRTEYLMNSLNSLLEYRNGRLPEDQKLAIETYLDKCDPGDPLAAALSGFIGDIETEPAEDPGLYVRLRERLHRTYVRIVEYRHFEALLNAFFVLQLLAGVAFVLLEILTEGSYGQNQGELGFSEVALMISSSISGLFIFLGVINLRRSHLAAYKMFERAMLVKILLSQVFLFTLNQLGAIVGLIFSLLVLAALRFLISRETARQAELAAGTADDREDG